MRRYWAVFVLYWLTAVLAKAFKQFPLCVLPGFLDIFRPEGTLSPCTTQDQVFAPVPSRDLPGHKAASVSGRSCEYLGRRLSGSQTGI